MSNGGIKIDLTPKQGAIVLAVMFGGYMVFSWWAGPIKLDDNGREALRDSISRRAGGPASRRSTRAASSAPARRLARSPWSSSSHGRRGTIRPRSSISARCP